MTAIGKTWQATLTSNERGPLERKQATSRQQAFLKARLLLDAAERRTWNLGETVSVSIAQSED